MIGAQIPGPSSTAFAGPLGRSCIGNGATRTSVGTHMDADVVSCGLPCCAVMLLPFILKPPQIKYGMFMELPRLQKVTNNSVILETSLSS